MSICLVTGANRGIGLELTRRLVERGDRVFAGARRPESTAELMEMAGEADGRLVPLKLDVTNVDSIETAVENIRREAGSLDLLINNAGIFPKGDEANKFGSLMIGPMLEGFRVNTIAPLIVAQEFTPLLAKGNHPKVVSISSQLGSIETKKSGGNYAYCISKAAVNMAMRVYAWDVRALGITSIVIHPGWVRTDMGGANADISPEESAQGILMVTDGLTINETGGFFDWRGRTMDW